MLPLLTPLALAADIAPGSHVLVKQGAPISRPGGGWSAVPLVRDVAWPAEVLADDGDTLRVRVTRKDCVDDLVKANRLDVAFTVREADLVPMVVTNAQGVEKTGEVWYVGAGTPVVGRTGGVRVLVAEGVEITVPDTVQVGLATPAVSAWPPLPTGVEKGEVVANDGVYGTFRGVPVRTSGRDARFAVRQDGRVRFAWRCASFTFDGPGPELEVRGTFSGWDFLGPGQDAASTGQVLYWEDGTPAGRLREPVRIPDDAVVVGELRCLPFLLTSTSRKNDVPTVSLCVNPADKPVDAKLPAAPTAGAPAPGPLAGTVTIGDPILLGNLDKSLLDDVLTRHLGTFEACYQAALAESPALSGTVVVKFVVSKDGSVSSAVTKSTTLNNPAVEACLNGRLMRVPFPAPNGGGIVIASYPFTFAPPG